MKKVFILLGLAAISSAVAVGVSTKTNFKQAKADPDSRSIVIDSSDDFENWTNDAGTFDVAGATYWPTYAGYHSEDGDSYNYPFEAIAPFFRGESAEGWVGTLTLNAWTQTTRYIYFQWGGANNATNEVYLDFKCKGASDENFYSVGTLLNDTFVDNKMMLKYFEIPEETFTNLGGSNGFQMKIDLVDGRSSNYGFHSFGYLHINQTKEEVADAMRYYLNSLSHDSRTSQVRLRKAIQNHYFGNAYLKQVFYSPVSNIDDDFEDNNEFLNHWYFDYNYFNGGNWDLHFDRAIGSDTFRPEDATKMPFNLTGSGFFRGWYENADLGGFVSGDGSIYRFISRPFVLSGTGLISVKMAGAASIHVFDTATQTELVWADSLTFNTSGDQVNLANSSFNTVTMVRHIINLEAYVGRTIQLAIADVSSGGWSGLYIDELVSNYATATDFNFKVDAVTQTNTSGTFYPRYLDRYINSTLYNGESNPTGMRYVLEADINKADDNAILNHVDNSAAKEAYLFLEDYYDTFRADGSFKYLDCAGFTSAELQKLCDDYSGLSANAKAIVDDSEDFTRGSNTDGDWFTKAVVKGNTVGTVVTAIIVNNHLTPTDNGSSSNFFLAKNENNIGLIIVISISALTLLGFAVLFAKKRKQN